MATSFQRVSHSLRADSGWRSTLALLVGMLLLTAWLAWAFRARITQYEVSDDARLEVDAVAAPVQAPMDGQLVSSALVLGGQVAAGDILVELDSEAEQLSLAQERARLASLGGQLVALQNQMTSEEGGQARERSLLGVSLDAAEAQYRQADAQAGFAEREADRAGRLQQEGILAAAEADRLRADAQSKRAAAQSLKVALARVPREQDVRQRDRDVRLKQMAADAAKIQTDIAVSNAAIKRLEYERERRRIRAPVAGRLTECAALRPGAHIEEGQQLGVILPAGKVRAVAEFTPAAALGKLRPGQGATLRLKGFPWAEYGVLPARVSRVAGEVRDGKIRVELDVAPEGGRLPVQHALPASVEVETERLSPAALILRSAGEWTGAH